LKTPNIDIKDIDTVILVGGLGYRLKKVLKDIPKCLAPINGTPFIDIILDNCIDQGLQRFIFCVGYLKEKIMDHLTNRKDCEIIYSTEKTSLGTCGAIKNAESYIRSKQSIILNGDTFVDINYQKLIDWHNHTRSEITLVISKINDTSRYGLVNFDQNNKIKSFVEKKEGAKSGWINSGVYIINNKVLDSLTQGEYYSLEKDLFPNYINKNFFAYKNDGFLIDIGTPESYLESQSIL